VKEFVSIASPPPPLKKGRGKKFTKGAAPLSIPLIQRHTWLHAQVYDTIKGELFKLPKKDIIMAEKPLPDLKTFIENMNKKDKHSGKKVRFSFVKRKRR